MLDFQPLKDKEVTLSEFVAALTVDDLRNLTNEMVDHVHRLIADCVDADVTFVPKDPAAEDKFAATPDEVNISWTLGHLIVHVTASAEESAALAAELARGVEFHGRSRAETPWQTVTTLAQCRARMEESRRMRLASLDMWPEKPHLDNTYEAHGGDVNAVGRFVSGLRHADSHLNQFVDVIQQAKAARA